MGKVLEWRIALERCCVKAGGGLLRWLSIFLAVFSLLYVHMTIFNDLP